MKNKYFFYIDVVGGCNLRCPSCPVGNSTHIKVPKGVMSEEFLGRIVDKALKECSVTGVALFNWTEPLLHPRLPSLIEIVKSRGIPCSISTNLSLKKDFLDLILSAPEAIYISLSGFTQEIYGRTHKEGDIELVKENMKKLSSLNKEYGNKCQITVMYHSYIGNEQEEIQMREFSAALGFSMIIDHARLTPIEKVIDFVNYGFSSGISTEDSALIDLLKIPLPEALKIAQYHKAKPCQLLQSQVVIDVNGDTQLCCAVFDGAKNGIGSFLNTDLDDIQEKRNSHITCTKCKEIGGHIYAPASAPEYDEYLINAKKIK
jgi:pyruvate-formate lyase-activating enzyme